MLKRGSLEVTKTSEDGLVEGMTFHLYGTSLSGLPVDEYAVTDSSGVARFENVLIGSGFVLEEVDTPICYVVTGGPERLDCLERSHEQEREQCVEKVPRYRNQE